MHGAEQTSLGEENQFSSKESTLERISTQQEVHEQIHNLDREVCIGEFLKDLDLSCSETEKQSLIPLLIEAEKALPKPFDQLPPKIAMIKVKALLPQIRQLTHSEVLTEKRAEKSELTNSVDQKIAQVAENDTAIAGLVNEVESQSELLLEQEQLLKKKLSGVDLLEAMSQLQLVKNNPKLGELIANFHKVLELTTTPEEQAIISSAIARQSISNAPDFSAFLQSEVFANSQISEETKSAIESEFKVPRVDSGTQIQSFLNEKNSDGTYRYETEGLAVRPGVTAGVNSDGRQTLSASVKGRASRSFDITGWNPEHVTELAEFLTLYTLSEEAGISSWLESCYDIDFQVGDDFDYDKQIRTRQVLEAAIGFNKGHDGKIIGSEDIQFFKWQLQIYSPNGDWAQGDHDIEATRQHMENLGIRTSNGQLDIEILEAVGSYTREIYLTGQPNYYDLQNHLHQLFGRRVPLTEENLDRQ